MATVKANDIDMLPHDYEAEAAILSSCLIDPDAIARAQEAGLEPSHFYREAYGLVYGIMLDLARRHEAVDLVMVGNALEQRGQADLIHGGIISLVNLDVSSVYVGHYAGLLMRLAERRSIIRAATEIVKAAHEFDDGPIDPLRDQASQLLADAMGRANDASHWMGTDEEQLDYLAWQEQRAQFLEQHPNGLIRFGLGGVDAVLDHLPEETLTIVAARAGVGKTISMEQCAEYNAQHGHPAAFYHYELSTRDMLHRRTTRHTGVPFMALRRGEGARKYRSDFNQLFDKLASWQENEILVHCPDWTAERVAADITRLHAMGKCDLAIIDYLQMIPLPESKHGANVAQAYGQIASTLKNCATHLGIPIVLGSQVRRTGSEASRPTDEDIRNSGEIKEKANQIIVLHRPNDRPEGVIPRMGDREKIEAYIDKSTFGATGKVNLEHYMGWFCFADPDQPEPAYEESEFDGIPAL